MEPCPGDDTIALLVCGQLPGTQLADLESHVGGCPSCQKLVGALRGTPELGAGSNDQLRASMLGLVAPGASVGRYRIDRMIGAGGMGVVYAAHDPELDRDVALKLLYPMIASDAASGQHDVALSARHESKAMARLRHPNVATIYDLGSFNQQLFLVMELVQGTTLRAWVGASRSWETVVATLVEAGKGLAAAHDAGIVHCDFKPDNVLVDAAGRPSITDFGLAQVVAGTRAAPRGPARATAIGSSSMIAVANGLVFGTPAYMAPERFDAGSEPDVQGDVFAFCVSLYEVLSGRRPFAGATVDELRESMATAPARPDTEAPVWLLDAIVRGLAWDRDTRYHTMAEVLAALAPPARRRRWPIAIAAGAIVVTAAGAIGYRALGSDDASAPVESCHTRTALAGIWDDSTKRSIGATWSQHGDATAALVWPRVVRAMDGYSDRWVALADGVCQAPSPVVAVDQFQRQCMRSIRAEMRAVTEQLATIDPKGMAKAERMVQSLPAIDDCGRDAPSPPVPSDPVLRAQVEKLREELATADGLSIAGKFTLATTALAKLQTEADALGFKPVVAEIAYVRALNLRGSSAKPEDTSAALREAAALAQASGDEPLAVKAWTALAFQAGEVTGDFTRGREYVSYAIAALERLGGNARLETEIETTRGRMDWHEHKLEAARKEYAHAVELAKDNPGMRIEALAGLALVDTAAGKLAQALDEQLQVLKLRRERYGDDHPEIARSYTTLGDVTMRLGKLDDSLAYYQKADATAIKVYGPEHSMIQITAHNLGGILRDLQRPADAEREFRRAVKIAIAAFGPDHPYVAKSQQSLGMALFDQNKFTEAVAELRHAVLVKQKAYGDDHIETIGAINDLAIALRGAGAYPESLAFTDKAIAGFTKAEPDSDDLAQAYLAKARTLIAAHRKREATAALDRAAALYAKIESAPQRQEELKLLRDQIAGLR